VKHARTNPRLAKLVTVFTVMTVLLFVATAGTVLASEESAAIEGLGIDTLASFSEVSAAADLLETRLTRAKSKGAPSYALQQLALSKAGELLGKIFSLYQEAANAKPKTAVEAKALLLRNRALIKGILLFNEAIIRDYQENRLDTLADPTAFFDSPAWQQPQQLISLASYWLGWNGYYTSLLLSKEDPLRKQVLDEAIDGFSRAFIDFKEDAITTKSLYGRGLAYKQLGAYGRAAYDFKSVKEKLPKSDPLVVRCLYEEAALSFDTGNLKLASNQLSQIREDFAKTQIPDDLSVQLNRLEANIFLAESNSKKVGNDADPDARDAHYRKTFDELKQLANRKEGVAPQLYQYVQAHASAFESMPYAELGPMGALAMGDMFFDRKEYDKATLYYTKLYAEPPSTLPDRMDRVCFRLAYLSSKKEQWDQTIAFLEPFPSRFPDSPLAKEASTLFHVAAYAQYKRNPKPQAYAQYIASLQRYLRVCSDCLERSEVHYQLGSHYRKEGRTQQALDEFLEVGTDSPNYSMATLHVLEFYIEQLESFQSSGQSEDERAAQLYRDANSLQTRVQIFAAAHADAAAVRATAPYRAVLQAKLRLFAPQDECKDVLTDLTGFETRFPKPTELHQEALGLRILCLYRLQRLDEAKAQIYKLSHDAPIDSQRYAFLQKLADRFYQQTQSIQAVDDQPPEAVSAKAALELYRELDAISQANPDYASFIDSIELRIARIHEDQDQLTEAIGTYEQILQRNPRSADALYALGLLYGKTGQWQHALEVWRRFSDGVQDGTHHWFVSRYETARALEQLGMLDRTCAIAKMTLVLHPDLGDEELAHDFEQMRARTCPEETPP